MSPSTDAPYEQQDGKEFALPDQAATTTVNLAKPFADQDPGRVEWQKAPLVYDIEVWERVSQPTHHLHCISI